MEFTQFDFLNLYQQFDLFFRQFPYLTEKDLDARIQRFSSATGRFRNMRAQRIEKHLFTIV